MFGRRFLDNCELVEHGIAEDACDNVEVTDSEDKVGDDLSPEYHQQLKQRRSLNATTCRYTTFGPDINTDDIINIASGEGNHPVSLSSEPNWEAMAFPVLFPYGKNTYNNLSSPRLVSLSPKNILIVAYCLWTADLLRVQSIFFKVCTDQISLH